MNIEIAQTILFPSSDSSRWWQSETSDLATTWSILLQTTQQDLADCDPSELTVQFLLLPMPRISDWEKAARVHSMTRSINFPA